MTMTRTLIRCAVLAGAIGLGACDLDVQNPNQPETERVLANPNDVEALLGSYYRRWHEGVYRTLGSVYGMASVQALEHYSSLANNGQNVKAAIPRAINDNSIGNTNGGEHQRVYFVSSEVTRIASSILEQLNTAPFTLGTPARDARAKAFGEFLRGVSLGYLALFYDSAAVVSQTMGTSAEDCVPEPTTGACLGALRHYTVVMDSALVALQRSLDHANATVTGTDGFPLPTSWIPSTVSFTQAEFVRLVRSYRARFRANVARTPAERAAVDWNAVITDSQNGITADHNNITNTVTGPFKDWVAQLHTYGLWHQMTPFVIGMADVSGSYESWIAQPLDQRGNSGPFFMVTPDVRFPQGTDRAAQQADFAVTSCSAAATLCKRYFRNRPSGNDILAGLGWGWSNYDFVRYHSWATAGDAGAAQNGRIVFFTKAELDLLEAEGHIRRGNFASAATLINKTRTRGMVPRSASDTTSVAAGGGLPPITLLDGTSPVPGGAACVPKVPVNATRAGGGTLTCGNMMEALKYEKRLETSQSHLGAWFLDSRGWGDLVEGTPLHWAVPYQDLQARGRPSSAVYSTGVGTAGGAAAAPGTYGW
jgi:hypothetical protein